MATTTGDLQLTTFADSDYVKFEDVNSNFQKLDTAVSNKLGKNDAANSAKKLQTARKINGVEFDGTTDINISMPAFVVGVDSIGPYLETNSGGTSDYIIGADTNGIYIEGGS